MTADEEDNYHVAQEMCIRDRAWLEYETDSNDVFYVRVDRTRKVPITVLIRALGVGTNDEIRELFGDEPKIEASFSKDTSENYQEGLLELYKKIRPEMCIRDRWNTAPQPQIPHREAKAPG